MTQVRDNQDLITQRGSRFDALGWTEKSRQRKEWIGYLDLKEGDAVLEVGCGTSSNLVLAKITTKTGRAVGIDIDKKRLKKSEKKIKKFELDIQVEYMSVLEMKFKPESFDAIICTLVMHHLTREEKRSALTEMKRVLRPGGRILVVDFFKPHGIGWLAWPTLAGWGELRRQMRNGIVDTLNEVGFASIECKRPGWVISAYLVKK